MESSVKRGCFMRKVRIVLPIGLVVILLSLWAGTQLAAIATGGGATNAVTKAPAQRALAPVTTSHKVAKKNYLETDIAGISVPAFTFTPVGDPITANCPGTSGTCTFEMVQNQQYCYGASGTIYYIAVAVDGGFLAQSPYSGQFASESCDTTAWTYQATGISLGNHSVQFYAYTSAAATVVDYSFVVRVYHP